MHHHGLSFKLPAGIQLFFQKLAGADRRIDQSVSTEASVQRSFRTSNQAPDKGTVDTPVFCTVPGACADTFRTEALADILK